MRRAIASGTFQEQEYLQQKIRQNKKRSREQLRNHSPGSGERMRGYSQDWKKKGESWRRVEEGNMRFRSSLRLFG